MHLKCQSLFSKNFRSLRHFSTNKMQSASRALRLRTLLLTHFHHSNTQQSPCVPFIIRAFRSYTQHCRDDITSNISNNSLKRVQLFGCNIFRPLDSLSWRAGASYLCQHGGNILHKHHFSSQTDQEKSQGGGNAEMISVTFVDKHGEEKTIKVPIGMSMLEAAHQNDIELEGACEGSLACSTCHVIVMESKFYDKLPEPTDEENDMLDMAFGLTDTSRLGCQVIAAPELDGLRLALPAATRNFAVDGYVPKPH